MPARRRRHARGLAGGAAEAGPPPAGEDGPPLPASLFTLFDGGRHADNRTPIQELMVAPAGVASLGDVLRLGGGTRQALG